MKYLFLFIVIFNMMLNTSYAEVCGNRIDSNVQEKLSIINNTSFYKEDIHFFYALNDAQRKLMFANLSSANKFKLWEVHLTEILNALQLDKSSETVINDVIKIISNPDFFDSQTLNWDKRFNRLSDIAFEMLQDKFNAQEFKYLFLDVKSPHHVNHFASDIMSMSLFNESPNPCKCSTYSNWCRPFRCKPSNCDITDWGCGSFWRFPCDGSCGGISEK